MEKGAKKKQFDNHNRTKSSEEPSPNSPAAEQKLPHRPISPTKPQYHNKSKKRPFSKKLPSRLNRKQVKKAIESLLELHQKIEGKKEKRRLLDDAASIFLHISLKERKPEIHTLAPRAIYIPHPLYDNPEICVIIKDSVIPADYKEILLTVEGVKKVINTTKLRKNYTQFEARRKLRDSYTLFMIDKRVANNAPKLLGKTFFSKKKQPISISCVPNAKVLQDQIAFKKRCTYLFVHGPTTSVRVARLDFSVKQIVENVLVAVDNVVQRLDKQWDSVVSLFVKTPLTTALPIYASVPNPIPPAKTKKDNNTPLKRLPRCKFNANCKKTDAEHLSKYYHPQQSDPNQLRPRCKFANNCRMTSADHKRKYYHPLQQNNNNNNNNNTKTNLRVKNKVDVDYSLVNDEDSDEDVDALDDDDDDDDDDEDSSGDEELSEEHWSESD